MVNIIEEFVKIIAGLDISRVTVFGVYAKIKKITGAMYDKKTLTLTLDWQAWLSLMQSQVSLMRFDTRRDWIKRQKCDKIGIFQKVREN